MAGRQTGSAELRDALDRFYALSTRDQLEFFARAREHLGSEAWGEDEVEKEIGKRAEALEALEAVADDLRARGEFREGKSPTVKEFDAAAERLGLGIRSGVVIGAFIRWRVAKTVLEGGRARERPSRRRAKAAAVGRARTHEDYLQAVRFWLATDRAAETRRDYDAFVDEENRKRSGSADRPLPSSRAVTTGLRLGWRDVIPVARGDVTHERALEVKEAELLKGLTDESLVGGEVVTVITGARAQRIGAEIRDGVLPAPAAKIGRVHAWVLGDLMKVRDGQPVPRRREFFFQDEVIDLPGLGRAIGFNVDHLRTLLNEEAWDRVPRPDGKVSGSWYWLRSDIDVGKWKARRGGRSMSRRSLTCR